MTPVVGLVMSTFTALLFVISVLGQDVIPHGTTFHRFETQHQNDHVLGHN